MSWMQTYSGKKFHCHKPELMDIHFIDIAHSLSNICRFNGHCLQFYSVAQHCVIVSQNVDLKNAMWGLLHDAGEAYVGDMIRPMKCVFPEFVKIEDNILKLIAKRFHLCRNIPDQVRDVDNRILLNERRDIMMSTKDEWGIDGEPLTIGEIIPVSPCKAEKMFKSRFSEIIAEKWCERYEVM